MRSGDSGYDPGMAEFDSGPAGPEGGFLLNESRTFPSRLAEVQRANGFLVAALSRATTLPIGEPLLFDLRLAVTETFANIVEHSYGSDPDQTLRMTIRLAPDRIELLFADVGRRPEPRRLRWRNLAEFRERGLGLFLLSKCMDGVTFHFRPDGVNNLHLIRRIGADAGPASRGGEHLPFHTAVFDAPDQRVVYLIGHFTQGRIDPFASLASSPSRRVVFDLTHLDFLDSHGIDCLARHARQLWKEGRRVSALEPPATVSRLIRTCGLMELLSPDGWATPPADLSGAARERFPGAALPLVRGLSAVVRVEAEMPAAALASALAPARFRAGALEGECVVSWAEPSSGLFVRCVERADAIEEQGRGMASGGVVFFGAFSRPGSRALVSAHQLHAMLGAYPGFARARGGRGHLADFVHHVSRIVRDTLPLATEGESGELLLAAVEYSPRGIRALTGTGPVLARCRPDGAAEALVLQSIPLGQSENPVLATIDIAADPDRDLRFHLAAGEGGAAGDQGVLDVRRSKA